MLEEKIEELKLEGSDSSKITSPQDTKIDLNITAHIPDSYFLSETDKLHFYREIELVEDIADLEFLKESFIENSKSEDVESLFLLLECQILAKKYNIIQIKSTGIHYQIDFDSSVTLELLKGFLKLDKEIKFQVIHITKLRSPKKAFENDKKFLKYLLLLLREELPKNKKIKLITRK